LVFGFVEGTNQENKIMRRTATLVMTVAVLALAVGCGKKDSTTGGGGGGGGGGGDSHTSSSSIEGTYVLVGMEAGGKPVPDEHVKKESEADRTIKITADKMMKGKEDPTTYKVDNSKTPHEIDMMTKGLTGKEEKMYGIYKLEGDKLTICLAPSDKPEDRPKEFKTSADPKAKPSMIMTLEKKK
jgi:uncharacterized protein (TIGR03067 family)